jgi:hypothetical protein
VIARHVAHDAAVYGRWLSEDSAMQPLNRFESTSNTATVRNNPMYRVVTPDECVDLAVTAAASSSYLRIAPLCGGLPPDVAWESLELFSARVLPVLRARGDVAPRPIV